MPQPTNIFEIKIARRPHFLRAAGNFGNGMILYSVLFKICKFSV